MILIVPGLAGAVQTKLLAEPVVGAPPVAVQLYPVAPTTAPTLGGVSILRVCVDHGNTVEPHIPEIIGGTGSPGLPIGL